MLNAVHNTIPEYPVPSYADVFAEDPIDNVLRHVEMGRLDMALEAVEDLKGIEAFSPTDFPEAAAATYIPYEGNVNPNDCEYKVADFLQVDLPPKMKAEAIVANIGSISVSPLAPNVIHVTAPDGGVHEIVAQQPEVMLDWLRSKGYQDAAPDQTIEFAPVDAPTRAQPLLPFYAKTQRFTFRQTPKLPTPTAILASEEEQMGYRREEPIVTLPVGRTGQEGDVAIFGGEAQDNSEPLPVSEQYIAIRHIMGKIGTDRLISRYGLSPEQVQRAMAETHDDSRLMQALPEEVTRPGFVYGFDTKTSEVVRAALEEIIATSPDIEATQNDSDTTALQKIENMQALLAHQGLARQAKLIREHPSLLVDSPTPRPLPTVSPQGTIEFTPVERSGLWRHSAPQPVSATPQTAYKKNLAQKSWNAVRSGVSSLRRIARAVRTMGQKSAGGFAEV